LWRNFEEIPISVWGEVEWADRVSELTLRTAAILAVNFLQKSSYMVKIVPWDEEWALGAAGGGRIPTKRD
jgi:hypothetical protein